jgi:hypothetical protein
MESIDNATWRKARYSGTNGGGCVEAGAIRTPDRVVLVRDTTNRAGAVLAIPADAWRRFTDALR